MNKERNNTDEAKRVDEENQPLTDWANEPSVEDLKLDYQNAYQDRDEQVSKIDTWLDYLHVTGQAKREKKQGQSSITPKLIRKQAEWRYASLSEPFLDNTDIFNIMPVSYEDKEAAEQNSIILNNQFNTKIKKIKFIDEYIRTAVDEGTVIVRVGWDYEEEVVEVPAFEIVPAENDPEVIQKIQNIMGALQQDPNYLNKLNPEVRQAFQLFTQDNIPRKVIEVGVQEEIKTIKNEPTVEIVDYRNITIDPTAQGDMDKANFVIHSFDVSLSQLEKDGKYTNLDQIDIENLSPINEPDHYTEEKTNFNFDDKARQKFTIYEYWGFWDIEGDGILQPIVATYAGNVMIRLEKNPFPDGKLPFVVASYLPVRRSVYGEPDGELLKDNQEVIGAVTRGMIDLMGKSANGQTGRLKNALDFVNKKRYERGDDYEINPNTRPDQAFYMHKYPEIPRSAEVMLTLQNAEAESLTGVRPFNQSTSGNIGSNTARGVTSAMDAASKRELGILRRLGQGILEIGRKIIAMNAVFLDEEEIVRVTNDNFIAIRRDDLAGEFDLRLSISTAESDNAKAEELAFMLQTTGQTMGPVFSQIILSEIAKLRKMPDLAKRIEQYQPQPDPLEQEEAKLRIELLKAQIYNETAKGHENNANANLDNAKAQNLSADTDKKNLDYLEQEAGVKQQRDLQLQGEQARSNIALEEVKHVNSLEKELLMNEAKNKSDNK